MRMEYSGSSTSLLATWAFMSLNLRAGPRAVSIPRRRWDASWSSANVCRSIRLYIAKLDVQVTHVLPNMRDLGLQIRDLSLDEHLLDPLIEQHLLT